MLALCRVMPERLRQNALEEEERGWRGAFDALPRAARPHVFQCDSAELVHYANAMPASDSSAASAVPPSTPERGRGDNHYRTTSGSAASSELRVRRVSLSAPAFRRGGQLLLGPRVLRVTARSDTATVPLLVVPQHTGREEEGSAAAGRVLYRARKGKMNEMDGALKTVDDTKASLLSEQERIAKEYRGCTDELDNAETSIRRRAQRLDERRNRAVEVHGIQNASDDDLLEINVGGSLIAARRGTLCQIKGSRFEAIFSGRWQKMLQKDREGRIFLDVNPKCFRALLDCLKDLKAESSLGTKPSIDDEYYRMLGQLSKMFGIQEFLPIYDVVGDSNILATDDKIMKLRNLLGEHDNSWNLLHRSTRDGFDPSRFHKNCDGKERTMTYSHPIKIGIKDGENGNNAIYSHHNLGPTYGRRFADEYSYRREF
ncbi:hypothetical protein THAOC_00747, partial [Thalassiosira oceanica]